MLDILKEDYQSSKHLSFFFFLRTKSLKNGPPKNGPFGKTGPQGLKTLSFISCHIKNNVEEIHFHIRHRGVQGLIFAQITFEKCTRNFCFENGGVGIKTTIANL